LFKARAQQEGGKEKFGCTLIFPKNVDRPRSTRPSATASSASGARRAGEGQGGLIKSPFLAGDGKEARNKKTGELHPGMGPDVFFIRPRRTTSRPCATARPTSRPPRRRSIPAATASRC
jgi:hypothetical protein